jgi:hypothetical protein
MYTGRARVSPEQAIELFNMCDYYQVDTLREVLHQSNLQSLIDVWNSETSLPLIGMWSYYSEWIDT